MDYDYSDDIQYSQLSSNVFEEYISTCESPLIFTCDISLFSAEPYESQYIQPGSVQIEDEKNG